MIALRQRAARKTAAHVLPLTFVLLLAALLAGCSKPQAAPQESGSASEDSSAATASVPDSLAQATFAGGCFWCVESAFQDVAGVQSAVSGFSGGAQPDPTYDEVSSGQTDYAEVVQVTYDPDQISYERLLHIYWRQIDPTDAGGQFADRGSQYRPAIFYHNQRQERLARQSKQEVAQSGVFDEPIAVKIEPFERFYAAKDYHQDFYKTHPQRYKEYYEASGRAPYLRRVWKDHPVWGDDAQASAPATTGASGSPSGPAATAAPNGGGAEAWRDFEKPSDAVLKKRLTDMQYRVTQQNGTEPAFQNAYYDNKRPGLYVDAVSGEPLFSSKDKFDSGTGWPSFYKPLEPELVVEKEDRSAGMVRTEVRSRYADSHLGHVFEWSGEPAVPTGLRYCLNSAALEFIPAGQLEEQGYGEYTDLFE